MTGERNENKKREKDRMDKEVLLDQLTNLTVYVNDGHLMVKTVVIGNKKICRQIELN